MIEAVDALSRGTRMVLSAGFRRYVFVPLAINLALYVATIMLLVSRFDGWMAYWMSQVPGWLTWLEWLIWPMLVVSLILFVFFTFTLVANLIASPFYGFLAEKIERGLSDAEWSDERSLWRQGIDSLKREVQKLAYFLPRIAFLLLLGFVPAVNVFAPLLWALFSAWSMAIQYLDYPMDNHQVSFAEMRRRLGQRWWPTLTFGGVIMATIWIPIVNLLIMPGAVAAAVMMWQRHYHSLPAPKS
ncbi:sulfate transporter CysZ [Phytohalomonas tamaricis]|uniref:sulfate transporter CysZ n=1 Tax=Phytohalomonas tamaricis TaxID=2081032 RepID=UPI000D0BC16C|nr:sulfate transporter CysZ [Phytohalomonas tamaricis]